MVTKLEAVIQIGTFDKVLDFTIMKTITSMQQPAENLDTNDDQLELWKEPGNNVYIINIHNKWLKIIQII